MYVCVRIEHKKCNIMPTPISAVFDTDLAKGDKGADVTRLQTLLARDQSVYPEGLITGIYGDKTVAAVTRFQLKYKVIPTASSGGAGKCGPKTRAKIKDIFSTPASVDGFNITVAQLRAIVPTLTLAKATQYLPSLLQAMSEFGIDTHQRAAAFIAQTAHESAGYSTFIENLNYSASVLTKTWPTRFPGALAAQYANNPEKIANRAYSNRLGNGSEVSGDGWRYRGRGVIQITGKTNYQACGQGLGLPLVSSPELLEDTVNAFRSAGWYWKSHKCNTYADNGDFIGLTMSINGGTNGLEDRKAYYLRAITTLL